MSEKKAPKPKRAKAEKRDAYQDFIVHKGHAAADDGIPAKWMPDGLFDFQQALVEWSLRKGRSAIYADCGMGKSPMELSWAENVVRHTNGAVLLLTPLAVSSQMIREGAKFGIEVKRADPANVTPGIHITNYERLHHLDPSKYVGVSCDECFAPGTPVDCVDSGGKIYRKRIENVRVGDRLANAAGIDMVADVHRREVSYVVKIKVADRPPIVVSPNHLVFTRRGWVGAQDLEPGDSIVATRDAVRMVRGDVPSDSESSGVEEVLRSILLSEMAHEPAGSQGQGAQAGDVREDRNCCVGMAPIWDAIGASGDGTDPKLEPDVSAGSEGENISPIERDAPRTFRAWGERSWFDRASADTTGCTRVDLGTGVEFVVGATDSKLSDALQARLGEHRAASRYRGGWQLALQPQAPRREEGCDAGDAWVESLEVLEQGHPDLERLRSPDGRVYLHDLGATRHPSFSVAGLLVHNSSVLKSIDGATRADVTAFVRKMQFRLLATATPSPNDFVELGTSSEALGYLGHMDMLSRFFKNNRNNSASNPFGRGDTRQAVWRFAGHAEQPFWRWVCSWARTLRKPSDLDPSFDDTRYVLPALIENEHVVEARTNREGLLFSMPAIGLSEEREERRRTLTERCERAASLVIGTGQPAVCWAHLNDEADLLEKLIPDAIQVSGRDTDEEKEAKFDAFSAGQARVLVTKQVIGAWGLNWQHCAHMTTFASHSFESQFQAVRRFWRFGQTRPVVVDSVISDGEQRVLANLKRKAEQADRMFDSIILHMRDELAINRNVRQFTKKEEVPSWLRSIK